MKKGYNFIKYLPDKNIFFNNRWNFFLSSLLSIITGFTVFLYIPPSVLLVIRLLIFFIVILAIFIADIFFLNFIITEFNKTSIKKKVFLPIILLFFGVVLYFIVPINFPYLKLYVNNKIFIYLIFFFIFVTIINFLSLASFYILKISPAKNILKIEFSKNKKLLSFFIYFFIVFFCSFFYLLAYWPAFMSPDSLHQWYEITNFVFDDAHPAFHTLINLIVTRIYLHPATISVFQIIFLSFVFAYGMYSLEKNGANKILLIVFTIIFSIIPTNGFFIITLWKDIPYSISILLLTIVMFKIYSSNGAWLYNYKNSIFFAISLLFASSFRHNGILVILFILPILFIVYFKYARNIILSLLIFFLLLTIIKGPIFDALKVAPPSNFIKSGFFLHKLGAIVKYSKNLTSKEKKEISDIMEIEDLQNSYSPYTVDTLSYNPKLKKDYFYNTDFNKFLSLFLKVSIKNPFIVLNSALKSSSLIWRAKQMSGSYTYTYPIHYNNFPLEFDSKSKIPLFRKITLDLFNNIIVNKNYYWLFIRPSLYIFISIFFVFLSLIKFKKNKILIILLPLVGNFINLFFFTIAQDLRYAYAFFYLFPFLVCVFFIKTKDYEEKINNNLKNINKIIIIITALIILIKIVSFIDVKFNKNIKPVNFTDGVWSNGILKNNNTALFYYTKKNIEKIKNMKKIVLSDKTSRKIKNIKYVDGEIQFIIRWIYVESEGEPIDIKNGYPNYIKFIK